MSSLRQIYEIAQPAVAGFHKELTVMLVKSGYSRAELDSYVSGKTGIKEGTIAQQINRLRPAEGVDLMALIEKFFEERE